ncbi:MAG: carbohydrate ABC transporter permease [Actinobacteria bacterium]|nr:carbohydrate ABC transporter permease [Actinomycetota bacterium]
MVVRHRLIIVLIGIILAILLVMEFFPIYWIITNSFKGYKDIAFYPPKFIFSPTFDNYKVALFDRGFFKNIVNSLIVSIISVVVAVLFGSMAAYGIIRLKVGGHGFLLFIISSRMLPIIVLVLPLYIIFKNLRLIDTYYSLIIVYTTFLLSFIIWQMTSFLKEVPVEMEEAAIVDGCNLWQVFFRIVLPISKPGLTAVAIFSFLGAWNEYLFASILCGSKITTAPVAASLFIVERYIPWGPLASASTLTLLPAFAFILIVQKQMVQGLTMGALKG